MGINLSNEMTDGTLEDLGIHLTLEQQIGIQLTTNHYPPVPRSMIKPCVEAIDAYNEGEADRLIRLPDGISWRTQDSAPAWAIIEAHHLDSWCDSDEDYLYMDED